MRILFLAKRHYTNKDAMLERYGRIYRLPFEWAASTDVHLSLLDYYGSDPVATTDASLQVASTPIRHPGILRAELRRIADLCPDMVIASGDCFVGLLALKLARKSRARFVFDIYDDYRKFDGYRAFLGWNAYGHLLRNADLVLYASQALAENDGLGRPWQLVPNGVDPAEFKPGDRTIARTLCGLANVDSRWVGYFGSLDPERGPADLIAAVGKLNEHDSSIRLVLCGSAPPDLRVTEPWVDYRGRVEHSRIPAFINACDVVVLPYRRGPIIDMASSCKIAEYLFCERPLVSSRTPNLLTNFPQQAAQLGPALCNPQDIDDLARAIGYQLEHQKLVDPPKTHTWASIAATTLATLERLPRATATG